MPFDVTTDYRVLADKDTGELLVIRGDPVVGDYQVIGPLKQQGIITDREGDEAKVTAEGRLEVTAETDLPATQQWTQLAAAGSTSALDVSTYQDHTFGIVVLAIDTSVDVRAEGSFDGSNWFNLDDTAADTQYTANGTFMMHKSNFRCPWVRFTFVSEAGGAAVTLDVFYVGGR